MPLHDYSIHTDPTGSVRKLVLRAKSVNPVHCGHSVLSGMVGAAEGREVGTAEGGEVGEEVGRRHFDGILFGGTVTVL